MTTSLSRRATIGIQGNFFFYFFAMGTTLPYFSPFFRENFGMTDRQIGFIFMVQPACALLVQPFWGNLADRTNRRSFIAALLSTGSAVFFLLLYGVDSFAGVLGVFFLLALVYTPLMSLGDSVALVWLGRRNRHAYARLRIAGTAGFLVAAPAMGIIFDRRGIETMVPVFTVAMMLAAVSLLLVPSTGTTPADPSTRRGGLLKAYPPLALFLFALFLTVTAAETAFIFLGLYTQELGGGHRGIGWIWMVSTLAELAVMPFLGTLISRLGVRRIIALGMAGAAIRWAGTGLVTTWWHLFPLQLLHICTFCCVYIGGITYMDTVVPSSRSASAQALFGALVINGGRLAAGAVSGSLAAWFGYRNLFFWCSIFAAAGFLVFLLFVRDPVDSEPSGTREGDAQG